MIKSMTAFASAEKTKGAITVAIEIRSYNSRYLDIISRVQNDLIFLEEKIKAMLSANVSRGRVEVKIQIKSETEESSTFEIDEGRAKAYFKALLKLNKMLKLSSEISLEHLLGAGNIIKPAEKENASGFYWPIVKDCLVTALYNLDAMRRREGSFIAEDFQERLSVIENGLFQIKEKSHGLAAFYRERLKDRIVNLTEGVIEIDPARIAQEAAVLADKCDISEEIVRTESHVAQFKAVMQDDNSSGRKLNFLLQEFNREFNTMSSKAQSAEISHLIVDLKSELEKIREQVQNVE